MKMKELWGSIASLLGILAFAQSLLHTILPPELRSVTSNFLRRIFHSFSSFVYFDIFEIDGVNTNTLYNSVQLYLSTVVTSSSATNRLSLSRAPNSSAFTFALPNNQSLLDTFRGVTVTWKHFAKESQQFSSFRTQEKRGFTLKTNRNDKSLVLDSYLDHIINSAEEIRRNNRDRLLYTNSSRRLDMDSKTWGAVTFKHPSTFDTLAIDPSLKDIIKKDLLDFASGREFYESTGRAWKRGYLLYGSPGTGKSSMIAAMANFLGYDVYDLELTEVNTNSNLRKLLMKTSSKSIIVIEDIDCSIDLKRRKKGCIEDTGAEDQEAKSITLSGLLNFTDGLWSCCGSERIFVFTTNHLEKLDPALLRSGRMDVHIHMSYCSFGAVKILIKNYLGVEDGELGEELLNEVEEVVRDAEITPADVSEVLLKNRQLGKEKAVMELLGVLKERAMTRTKNEVEERRPKEFEEEHEKRELKSPKE